MADVDEIFAEEEPSSSYGGLFNPIPLVLAFVASNGWLLVALIAAGLLLVQRLKPIFAKWKQGREDAEYHKDPDRVFAREEAVRRAREKQQQMIAEASIRAKELEKERAEKKRQEVAKWLEKQEGGHRLGQPDDKGDYLPLSGGASTSSYRPPKRSACKGGGCGK